MTIAQFSLVKKIPVDITRSSPGSYVAGEWVPGSTSIITIQANVHPFTDYQVMILPESDRTKSWLWVFSASELRQKKEGSSGYNGDRFTWNGEVYEVMKTQKYEMTVQDHFEAKAVRVELSPN